MTPEKRETAIKWLEDEIRSIRMAPKINGCGPENWADQLEVMETCLEAVKGCNQVANLLQSGCNLLTLDQLREMDGQPVWVEFEDGSGGLWGIVHISVFEQIVFPNGLHCTIGQRYYGKTYKPYAYPPANIDREAFGCPYCTPDADGYVQKFGAYSIHNGTLETGHCKPKKIKYCPHCSRPLTEEVWDELEKRVRG